MRLWILRIYSGTRTAIIWWMSAWQDSGHDGHTVLYRGVSWKVGTRVLTFPMGPISQTTRRTRRSAWMDHDSRKNMVFLRKSGLGLIESRRHGRVR